MAHTLLRVYVCVFVKEEKGREFSRTIESSLENIRSHESSSLLQENWTSLLWCYKLMRKKERICGMESESEKEEDYGFVCRFLSHIFSFMFCSRGTNINCDDKKHGETCHFGKASATMERAQILSRGSPNWGRSTVRVEDEIAECHRERGDWKSEGDCKLRRFRRLPKRLEEGGINTIIRSRNPSLWVACCNSSFHRFIWSSRYCFKQLTLFTTKHLHERLMILVTMHYLCLLSMTKQLFFSWLTHFAKVNSYLPSSYFLQMTHYTLKICSNKFQALG